MKNARPVFAAAATAAIVFVVVLAVSAAQAVSGSWAKDPVTIDGAALEWPVLTILEDGVSVAAANDDDYLYLAIATSDRQRRRQFVMTGLTIWLDRTGGRKQSYGIFIPGAGIERSAGRFGGAPSEIGTTAPEMPTHAVTHVEILGPGKDERRRLDLSFPSQIAVASGVEDGTQLYELRIPLATASSAQPFGLGATRERPVGLGVFTPKLERPQGRQGGSGGGRGGGRGGGGGIGGGRGGGGGRLGGGGGGGGRRGGGAGGGGRGRGSQAMKDLKHWTTATLAPRPN